MRPLRLELEGFGPYRERQGVDFSDVELFAITGPTGSGKSTLLDAMAFALYGVVPRVGRNVGSLVHPGASEARVRLTFQVGGRVYRVERVRGKRSEGRLFELGPVGERLLPLETLDALNRALEELLGLTYEAFTRALLLPQGEFDRFLKGEAKERRRILLDLFELTRLERAREKAASRKAALMEEKGRLEGELAGLLGVSLEAKENLERALADLTREIARLQNEKRRLEEAVLELKGLQALLLRKGELEGRLGRLRAEASRMAEVEERLKKALEAEAALPLWQDLRRKEEALAATAQELQRVRARLAQLEGDRRALAFDPEALKEAQRALLQAEGLRALEALWRRVGVKEHLAPRLGLAPEAYAGALESLLQEEALLADRERELSRLVEEQGRLREKEEALNRVREALKALVEEGGQTRAQVEALEKALRGAEAHRLRQELEELRRRREFLEEEKKRLEAELAQLAKEERRLGLLAYRDLLQPGEPCPLCGGVVHPLPPLVEGPGASDLRKRREVGEKALRELLTRLGAVAEEERAKREALETLGVEPIPGDPKELEGKLQEAQVRLQELREKYREKQGEARALEEEVKRLSQEKERLRQGFSRLEEAEVAWEETREALASLRWEKEALAAGLYRLLWERTGGRPVPEYIGALSRRVEELEKKEKQDRDLARAWEEASRTLAGLLAQEEEQRKALEEVKGRVVGLMPEEEAKALYLPPKEREALAERIRAHREELAQVEALLEEVEREARARFPGSLPPLAEVEARLRREEERLSEIQGSLEARMGEKAVLEERLKEMGERLKRRRELEARLAEVVREMDLWEKLAFDLQQNNFPAYLLGLRQRNLVERADELMATLSAGRYRLRSKEDEYQVLDLWTEAVRPVKTLSGGESFLASLSLALALSEELSRGRLGALFLDEGFGTLDPETLEVVAGVLEALPTRGRLVGIVTHVAALAERFPARLVVEKRPAGSRVYWA
ncbi:AAA family ATPase [Thermus scotoductus]|uniref:Exonuclease SbcC n=1 Tax=Thermus scotoductus TaxID=37636 RepID=A0A430QZV7_THESC|nr:SMC family ATPase [Thermus scotoductus]RTH00678.1 exonuclease SbcC [Thermus scotoductus]RTH23551.1 exonuclease SbcC [Thermus scotoductus]RTI03222.1 exonuclease SbcC [Thermus scotoductus]RTI17599.1 exonuclease SbcC [Thermus scotoductus]RTI34729.1 exonuclease SbcC [Thermus scotoductus]